MIETVTDNARAFEEPREGNPKLTPKRGWCQQSRNHKYSVFCLPSSVFCLLSVPKHILSAVAAIALTYAVSAQTGSPQPTSLDGPAPRLAGGIPDLSGVWQGGGPIGNIAQGLPPGEVIPLLPEAKKIMDARLSKDDPEANCLPTGVPRIAPYPWRIVQTPTHIFFLFEGNIHSYRQIFVDGRMHPVDPDPTWYGHSIGRWEGATLVVDTIGFNDKFWFDFKGHPHTEQLHIVERYTRTNFGTLVNEITIDDPGAYSRPFTVTFTARLSPGEELMEYICNENNQDVPHLQGPTAEPGDPERSLGTLKTR
jgi:hypothetical protein